MKVRDSTPARHAPRLPIQVIILALGFLAASVGPSPSEAAKHTPAGWRRLVEEPPGSRFFGQRKHIGWNRDGNRNFIDDEIEARFKEGDHVNVIVELNDCIPIEQIVSRLSTIAPVTYVGRLVSCAYMRQVPYGQLDSLAAFPEVAMVEWQAPYRGIIGTSTRAVQAVVSAHYGDRMAARKADGTGWRSNGSGWTGKDIVIAIFDTGVANKVGALPGVGPGAAEPIVAGFDATVYEDLDGDREDDSITNPSTCTPNCEDEPGDGTTDPDPAGGTDEHGTMVAAVALARAQPGADCGTPTTEAMSPDCGGVAPGAKLVDVKVCEYSNNCDFDGSADGDVMQGIDWVGMNRENFSIDVANFSISDGEDCDGNCAVCEAVNYLAALGVVPVAGFGNADCEKVADCADKKTDLTAGERRVATPAAASYAISVSGTNDGGTVDRDDDKLYTRYLKGPRMATTAAGTYLGTGLLGNKPDLAAPAETIETITVAGTFDTQSGTSYAAPQVAGAVALLLEADAEVDPADVMDPAAAKDLLIRAADKRPLGTNPWDEAYGGGLLNVYNALITTHSADLRFAHCAGAATSAGSPCPLTSGLPSWLNYLDLKTEGDLKVGETITIKADIVNDGPDDAKGVLVSFGVYNFGAGTNRYHEIGTQTVDISAGGSATVPQSWTISEAGHRCLQVTIHYGLDSKYGNNRTQRNLDIAASKYDLRVENPYMAPARFHVVAASERPEWPCSANPSVFDLGGPDDCPKNVEVIFRAPRTAPPGARANCNVSVFATRPGQLDSTLIGGVTVQTFVPRPCRLIGQVVDRDGMPLRGVRLFFTREVPRGILRAPWERERRATTDRDGVFDLDALPDAHQMLRVVLSGVGEWTIPIKPRCGVGTLRLQVWRDGIRLLR